jgi:hypothetical protein
MRTPTRTFLGCLVSLSILGLVLAGTLNAQSVVVPNSALSAPTGMWLNSLVRQLPRTFQMGIAAGELATVPIGSQIVGLSLRAGIHSTNPASWPATAASWKNYDITLAEAAVPLTQWSTTFAANMKNAVAVRQGPMTIPAGAWADLKGPGANPFDTFYFAFQQPYTYKGGDLVILITHDGNNVASAIYQERMADSPTTYGVGQYASTYNATTATVPGNGPMVTRIHFGHTITVCTGSGGLPPLLILSHALVTPTPPPGTVNFAVTNALGGAMGFLIVGQTRASIPLPNMCFLLVAPIDAVIPIYMGGSGAGNGRFDLNLSFPASSFGAFEIQAAVIDPGAAGGYVGTNSVSFVMRP